MTVWNDITAQVDNLKQVVARHAQAPRPELELAAGLLAKANRVIFSGVGSGLNATIPAFSYLMANGVAAQVVDSTEAIYDMLPGMRGAALVLNTRSGETAELIRLAQLAREHAIPTVAVTNELNSTVGKLATVAVPTQSRWDELVVISALGGMMATELALAGQVTGRIDSMLDDLQAAADAAGTVLQAVIEQRAALLELFREARPVYLLGRGPSIASTLGGELVLEEMARRPAVSMATGLFRQGPLEVVDERFRAFFFGGVGQQAALNARLATELMSRGAGVCWVGTSPLAGALNIPLPDLPAHVLPLLEIMPCHVLAYDLAKSQGYEPGEVRYIQRVITSEEGIPNENP
jgi:glucosamine--fructose-6-phosphate aminotransferase (isomerizing)